MVNNSKPTAEIINQYHLSSEKVCSNVRISNQNITDSPSPMGRLKSRYDELEKVTSNPFILGVIKDGYKLPF